LFLTGKPRPNGFLARLGGSTRADRIALTPPEFREAFKREKALASRNLRSFSLVVFRPIDPRDPQSPTLLPILEERLRCYDVIGQLGFGKYAALLPETDTKKAVAVAEAIVGQAALEGVAFHFQIRTYPLADRGPGSGPPGDDDGETLETTPPSSAGEEQASTGPESVEDYTEEALARDLGFLESNSSSWPRRLLDIAVAGTALALLSPLFLVVGFLVKVTSPGPIIFKQRRAGQWGEPFWFYKFRSMKVGADRIKKELQAQNEKDGPIFKIKNDPRMTPLGRFLRRTSIDELPQLWNVLKGDMTLVGPRPPTLDEVAEYEAWQFERLSVRGGLTCLWQVSGRSEIGFEDWVRLDLRYAQRRSAGMDLNLLLRTAKAVISGRGAY